MKKLMTALMASAVIVVPTVQARAEAPRSTEYRASLTVRDAAGDVMLSDGLGTYAGSDTITSITDQGDPTVSDRAQFQPWRKRELWIQNALINDGAPTECSFAWSVFESSTTPDWFTVGGGFGHLFFHCDVAGADVWRVTYPEGGGECVQADRTDAITWTFTAPAYATSSETGELTGCPATFSRYVSSKGKNTLVAQHAGISAPFEVTTRMEP